MILFGVDLCLRADELDSVFSCPPREGLAAFAGLFIERKRRVTALVEKARSRSTTGGTRWESEYFRKWVATQPCVITGKATFGEIHAAHITSRGAGGDDFLNVIPLHHEIHRFQHDQGWDKVYGRYSLTGAQLCQKAAHTLKTWLIQCDALIRQARVQQANRKEPYKEGQTP